MSHLQMVNFQSIYILYSLECNGKCSSVSPVSMTILPNIQYNNKHQYSRRSHNISFTVITFTRLGQISKYSTSRPNRISQVKLQNSYFQEHRFISPTSWSSCYLYDNTNTALYQFFSDLFGALQTHPKKQKYLQLYPIQ